MRQETKEELQETIKRFKRMGAKDEFDIGFCNVCNRYSVFSRKNLDEGWKCTNWSHPKPTVRKTRSDKGGTHYRKGEKEYIAKLMKEQGN